ncbi:MAG: hypothetical protein NE330_21905, partial [Lentisphaeraceae bacterium]|nr:hypothetical protein [Lentisphaeraceae bacterium]
MKINLKLQGSFILTKQKLIASTTILFASLIIIPLCIRFISVPFAQKDAKSYFAVNHDNYRKMANGMDYWIDKKMGREHFNTGSQRFDGEWLFGTYLMTAIGYTQEALIFPEMYDKNISKIKTALEAINTESIQKFDFEAWGESPLTFKTSDHAAYL